MKMSATQTSPPQDTILPEIFTYARLCRLADGPDEVHMSQLGKLVIKDVLSK